MLISILFLELLLFLSIVSRRDSLYSVPGRDVCLIILNHDSEGEHKLSSSWTQVIPKPPRGGGRKASPKTLPLHLNITNHCVLKLANDHIKDTL